MRTATVPRLAAAARFVATLVAAWLAAFAVLAAGTTLAAAVLLNHYPIAAAMILAVTLVLFYGGQRAAYAVAVEHGAATHLHRDAVLTAVADAVHEPSGRHSVDMPTNVIRIVRAGGTR